MEIPVDLANGGKIQANDLKNLLSWDRDCHSSKPRVLTITSPTESGAIYSIEEIKALSEVCLANDMFIHLDGARFANAIAAMGGVDCARQIGKYIDVLSFGGTKNGMMGAEAIVFMNHPERTPFHLDEFERVRKQGLQLFSKTRFLTYQFEAILEDDLWIKLGEKSNALARELASGIQKLNSPLVRLATPVETNQVFLLMRKDIVEQINKTFKFYTWKEEGEFCIVRLVTCSEIPQQEVNRFLDTLKVLVKK